MSKNTKKTLSQRICESLDIPLGTLGRTSFIEATGNRQLIINGCFGLKTYTDREVVLELCDGPLSIMGHELELKSFSNGDVEVLGIITDIHYGEKIEVGDDC